MKGSGVGGHRATEGVFVAMSTLAVAGYSVHKVWTCSCLLLFLIHSLISYICGQKKKGKKGGWKKREEKSVCRKPESDSRESVLCNHVLHWYPVKCSVADAHQYVSLFVQAVGRWGFAIWLFVYFIFIR